ncbi:MAG: alpha/beta hydrolase [Kiloniellales bacterium]|nr:alpha/beta hydrolase [Kiloniellales bacterium]
MADTRVYFATNRRPNDPAHPTDFTEDFVGDLTGIRFGTANVPGKDLVRINDDEALTALGKKIRVAVEPEDLDPGEGAAPLLGSTAVFQKIRADMQQGRDLLFLVHGYDYTFRQAVARAAQISQWYGKDRPLSVLLYTWPSLGAGVSPFSYKDERQRAKASGPALGRILLKAADFIRNMRREGPCLQRIHLMAHSMGNWVLRGGIEQARTFVGDNIPPLIDEVFLMAADDDDDTLSSRNKMQPLLRGCRRVHVYYHGRDLALKASDYAMGNPDRLGLSGPDDEDSLPKKVYIADVGPAIIWDAKGKNAWTEDKTGHQYYRNNARVRDDVVEILQGKADDEFSQREKGKRQWRFKRTAGRQARKGRPRG